MSEMMENIDLELEYSPSRWSPRFPSSQEVMRHHIQNVTAASELAIQNIPHELEIAYGPTPGQKLDILGVDLPNDAPILMFVHGGYWQELSRGISRYASQPLYRAGVKTIVVGYDLCPAVTLAEIVHQIQNAARFVFEYAEKMGSRGVYFAGHSAGAHLIAKSLASAELIKASGANRLQGAFLISGVYDLQELVHTSVNEAINLTEQLSVSLSPQFDSYAHLKGEHMRVFVIVANHDSPRFKKQSKGFYELLCREHGEQNVCLKVLDDLDHFDIVECLSNEENYLKTLLLDDIRKNVG